MLWIVSLAAFKILPEMIAAVLYASLGSNIVNQLLHNVSKVPFFPIWANILLLHGSIMIGTIECQPTITKLGFRCIVEAPGESFKFFKHEINLHFFPGVIPSRVQKESILTVAKLIQ